MKNIMIVMIMFVASLMTVSTLANADAIAKVNAEPNLVIYRPDDGSSLSYRIWVNDQYMGKLKLNEALKLNLQPGEHTIRSNDRERSELQVTVTSQGTTYVRSEIYRKTRMSLALDKIEGQAMAGL